MPVIADTEITVDFLCGKGGIINFQSRYTRGSLKNKIIHIGCAELSYYCLVFPKVTICRRRNYINVTFVYRYLHKSVNINIQMFYYNHEVHKNTGLD